MNTAQCTCLTVLLALTSPAVALAAGDDEPPPVTRTAEQVKREMDRVMDEVAKLRESPQAPAGWKEKLAIEIKLAEAQQRREAEDEPLRRRWQETSRADDVAAWGNRIDKLYEQYEALRTEDYRLRNQATGAVEPESKPANAPTGSASKKKAKAEAEKPSADAAAACET